MSGFERTAAEWYSCIPVSSVLDAMESRSIVRGCLAEIDRLVKLAEMRGANYDLVVNERNEALAQGRRWREKLAEMLDQYEYACQYKSKYLVKKHGDAELIAEARALLAETEGS